MFSLPKVTAALMATLALAACADDMRSANAPGCGSAEARLAELGVPTADIASITVARDGAGEGGGTISIHAWVRLHSCTGYLVVRLDSSCGPRGSDPYVTGNCRLPEKRAG